MHAEVPIYNPGVWIQNVSHAIKVFLFTILIRGREGVLPFVHAEVPIYNPGVSMQGVWHAVKGVLCIILVCRCKVSGMLSKVSYL